MRILLAATTILVSATSLAAQATPTEKAALHWGPAPAVFPKGAQMAVVSGDPGKAAPFIVELSLPDGYRLPPHFHPTEEIVEVKKGTFLFGMGDTLDAAKAKTMKVGDKGTIGANMHHYALAKGATVVEVSSQGPFALIYVNPTDDPTRQASKP